MAPPTAPMRLVMKNVRTFFESNGFLQQGNSWHQPRTGHGIRIFGQNLEDVALSMPLAKKPGLSPHELRGVNAFREIAGLHHDEEVRHKVSCADNSVYARCQIAGFSWPLAKLRHNGSAPAITREPYCVKCVIDRIPGVGNRLRDNISTMAFGHQYTQPTTIQLTVRQDGMHRLTVVRPFRIRDGVNSGDGGLEAVQFEFHGGRWKCNENGMFGRGRASRSIAEILLPGPEKLVLATRAPNNGISLARGNAARGIGRIA